MDRARVAAIRIEVLHLHKAIIDIEREVVERVEGRLTPHEFLERLMHDESFAWLKLMSAVIVGLDEWLDDTAADEAGADAYVEELRRLLAPDPAGDHFQRRYAELLQSSPAVVMAHSAVTRALG
jgi:hypothetical protein